jgi:hypothetical protein
MSASAVAVMKLAGEEAGRLGQDYIGDEHVLLGLLRHGGGLFGGRRHVDGKGLGVDTSRRERGFVAHIRGDRRADTRDAELSNVRTCVGFIVVSGPITSRTSPPEQKPRPAPVMTIARMSGSSLDLRRASWRSSRKVSPSALRRSMSSTGAMGSVSRATGTPASKLTMTSVGIAGALPGSTVHS